MATPAAVLLDGLAHKAKVDRLHDQCAEIRIAVEARVVELGYAPKTARYALDRALDGEMLTLWKREASLL